MDMHVYVCTGGCGAVISQEQYDGGLQACGADGCDHKGILFEKRMKCEKCGNLYKVAEEYACTISNNG